MSTILSIYAGKHDAAICVLQNGKVVINFEKERYSRIKEDGGFCKNFLFHVLEKIKLSINEIDILVLDFKTSPLNIYEDIVSSITGIPVPTLYTPNFFDFRVFLNALTTSFTYVKSLFCFPLPTTVKGLLLAN